MEFYHYFETIKGAVEQVKRKAQVISNNLNSFLDSFKMQGKADIDRRNVKIIPFVLTNQPLGVGFPIDDIAIIDLIILNSYLDKGKF